MRPRPSPCAGRCCQFAGHPGVQEELDAEIATVLGGGVPEVASAESLTYTKMVVDESLRMHRPSGSSQGGGERGHLGGYDVEPGSSVVLSRWSPTTTAPLGQPRPSTVPVHPAGHQGAAADGVSPVRLGARQCVGNFMALLELRIIVAMVNQRFRISRIRGPS
ncbi:hypothetical protein GCM10017744_025910 [Streptomyces antimycoticus]